MNQQPATSNQQPPTPLPTVILAGGKAKPEMQAVTGMADRSQVVVAGKTLLRHVVDGVRTAGEGGGPLGPIVVVGNPPISSDYACVSDTGDFVGNLFAGLRAFPDAPFVLIATSDLPFVTGAEVGAFVRAALAHAHAHNADLVWPVVPVALCYERYPGVRRTALKVREGHFTGGNLALVRPKFLLAQHDRVAGAYAARKSPLKLAVMLGIETVTRLLLSQKVAPSLLTIPFLEARVGALLGGSTRAIIVNLPEIATDLDRPSDFDAVGLKPGS